MKPLIINAQNFLASLLIQPLYVQFLVQFMALSIIFRYTNHLMFDSTISTPIIFIEAIYGGIAFTVGGAYRYRKKYGLNKGKDDDPRLKYWTDFQRAVVAAKLPRDKQIRKSLPWFIEGAMAQRKQKLIYAPLVFLVGGVVNILLYTIDHQTTWLFFVSIFIVFAFTALWDSALKTHNMKKILSQLKRR